MRNLLAAALCVLSHPLWAAYAPGFNATFIDGSRTTLQEQIPKDKLLLVSFWATWCVPCLQELTSLSAKLKNSPIPLKVVTVNVDSSETKSQVRPTLADLKNSSGFDFPVILDPTQTILLKYQPSSALPFSVLIGPDGSILESFTGYQQSMFQKIQALAEKHFPKSSSAKVSPSGSNS